MKKVLIATGVAVLAFASLAGAQGYMYNTNLTVGSTGPDVSALQNALMGMGYSIPAISSGAASPGYFGAQTKAAVMQYQAARGIPNTGFVGPLTRAALNGGGSAPVASNCLPGWSASVYQGQTFCLPPGFSVPGSSGTPSTPSTPGVITTRGAEGLITTKLASNPISDANIRGISDIPVYGIEVKAQGSDMIVDRALLQFQLSVGKEGSSESNPGTFVREISAYDGSTLLKSWNVGMSDFNKDSSDRYYFIASGLNFLVPKDATKVLTFKVDVVGVSSDQSSRILSVQGYAGNTQNVRAIDGAGMNSYTDMSGDSNERDQTFTASGASSLTISANSSLSPKAQNHKVDSTDGVKDLTMQVIDVKSSTGPSTIKTIYVAANATTTAGVPSTLYLYDGSTLLGSKSTNGNGNAVAFTDLNLVVGKDQTKQLTVKADFASTVSGQGASTSLAANGIKFEKPDSTTASSTNSAIAGNSQYLWSAAPQWTLVSASSKSVPGVLSVSSSTVEGTIVLKAKAVGGAMTKPVVGDFTVRFASSTASSYTTANAVSGTASIQVSPSDATVSEGNEYTVTITGAVASNDSEIATDQYLFMVISEIDSVVGDNTITNQTWGLDTFVTPPQLLDVQ